MGRRSPGQRAEFAAVVFAAALLAVIVTFPLVLRIGSVGRVDNGDGKLSIWNVAWVARAIVVDPLHVFDANIFYPHRDTLAYSESNIGAGVLAAPVYWATRNPYAAYNFVMLSSIVMSATGMYYLARAVSSDRRAAAVAAIAFACCPFVFAHTAHVQLLMTAGLPICLLAFHRMADEPTRRRGALLGAAMALQAICCGYYGVFVTLMIAFAIPVVATTRRLWTDWRFWKAIIVAAGVALVLVGPVFLPYLKLQQDTGFRRELADAEYYSANWSDYFASSAYAHAWLRRLLPPWLEVSFPGFGALALGTAGVWVSVRQRRWELLALYGGLGGVALWASFGPRAVLYGVLYRVIPFFAWLRAPARFGIVVELVVIVFGSVGLAALLRRTTHPNLVASLAAVAIAAELATPMRMPAAPPVAPVYRTLATLPHGAVIEMPFFYPQVGLFQHTTYMLASTAHWMPLVNGYSDYIPADFLENVMTLAPFPSRDAFKVLEPNRVRYAVFHMNGYNAQNRREVLERLTQFQQYLRPIYMDQSTRLYELVGFPP